MISLFPTNPAKAPLLLFLLTSALLKKSQSFRNTHQSFTRLSQNTHFFFVRNFINQARGKLQTESRVMISSSIQSTPQVEDGAPEEQTFRYGEEVFQVLLNEKNVKEPLRSLEEFKDYVQNLISWKSEGDPVFSTLCAIRDRKRARLGELAARQARLAEAAAAYAASPGRPAVEAALARVRGAQNACDGLHHFLSKNDDIFEGSSSGPRTPNDDKIARKVDSAKQKLAAFEAELSEWQQKFSEAVSHTPEYSAKHSAEEDLESFLVEIGVRELEAECKRQQKKVGNITQRSGKKFEDVNLQCIETHLIPMLEQQGHTGPFSVLKGATLGCASAEFDYLVVTPPPPPTSSPPAAPPPPTGEMEGTVEQQQQRATPAAWRIVAIVEVKRNINDIGKSFGHFQNTLDWFTGQEDTYDPENFKNKFHRNGHFQDHTEVVKKTGEYYFFDRSSFALFAATRESGAGRSSALAAGGPAGGGEGEERRRGGGGPKEGEGGERERRRRWRYAAGLHFLTAWGCLEGLHSGGVQRLARAVATDVGFDLGDDACMGRLLEDFRRLEGPHPSTREVLEMYRRRAGSGPGEEGEGGHHHHHLFVSRKGRG